MIDSSIVDLSLQSSNILDVVSSEVQNAITKNQFFQGGLILGILAWLGMQFKEVPISIYRYIRRFIYYTVIISEVDDKLLYYYFSKWMSKNYSNKCRNVTAAFSDTMNNKYKGDYDAVDYDSVSGVNNDAKIMLRQSNDINYIFRGNRIIRVENVRQSLEGATHIQFGKYHEYKISGWFAKKQILDIIDNASIMRDTDKHDTRFINVRSAGSSGYYDEYKISTFKTFDDLYFKGKDTIKKYLDRFKENKKIYSDHGIVYKSGIMLHGPPGTGKSKTVLAIADYLRFEITAINISTLSSDDALRNAMLALRPNSVVVFEDIDDSFGGTNRGNLSENKNRVSFAAMLQLLDGILSPDGIIFIFTTNDPNSLDPALYRDGRINLIVEMSYPMVTDVCDYLSDYFDIKMSTSEFISSVLGGKGFDDTVFPLTLATVENLCIFNDDVHEVLKQLKNML